VLLVLAVQAGLAGGEQPDDLCVPGAEEQVAPKVGPVVNPETIHFT
jgi:hypothetical protein